jgi:hypothetical protein
VSVWCSGRVFAVCFQSSVLAKPLVFNNLIAQ